jgi:hypothetical protein
MIVLHEPQIIFLKSRKTAGSSLEIALSWFSQSRDIVTPIGDGARDDQTRERLGFPGPKNFEKNKVELLTKPTVRDIKNIIKANPVNKFHNHCSAARAKRHLDEATWKNFKKISIVRNPWDYMVSSYYWANRYAKELPDFEAWCLANQRLINRNRKQYFIGRTCIIDRFLVFERLRADIEQLERDVPKLSGLSSRLKEVRAKGNIRPKSGPTVAELFDRSPRADELISRSCRFEIERFGYQRPRRESI